MATDTNKLLRQAIEAHNHGCHEEAERKYREILKRQPSHADANHNLGVLAISANQPNRALRLFKIALNTNPKIERFWLSYISALISGQHLKIAKRVLKQSKKQGIKSKELDALEASMAPSIKQSETNNVSPLQEQKNNLLALYQGGQWSEAEHLALSLTKQFPKHPFAWKVVGAIFGQTGKKNEAVYANQIAVNLAPEDFEAHSNLGNTLCELGRLDEAEASLKRSIALRPEFSEAHNNLGIALQEQGRFDEARASFIEAIALKPECAEAHNNLGTTSKELGILGEAEASYKRAFDLKPNFAEAYTNLSTMLTEAGRLEEAEANLIKAIALKPDYAKAYNDLGCTLRKLGRLKEAEASYNKAIVLDHEFADAYSNLGVTLQELGRLEEAAINHNRAITLTPDYAEAYSNLGVTLKELGRLDEAEASYSRAIAIKPDSAEALYNRSQILFERGEYEASLNDADACALKKAGVLPLISLYALGRISEIYDRIEIQSEGEGEDISIAAFAAFISEVEKKPAKYSFCPNPLDLIHVSNLSSHTRNSSIFIAGLIQELNKIETVWEPQGKATVGGFQSARGRNLFESPNGNIALLKSFIIREIEKYYLRFQKEPCSYIQKFPAKKILNGWSVILKNEGHQDVHIHPEGWLSGVIYLKVVPSLEKNEGAIEFSLNGRDYFDHNAPRLTFEPEEGDIVFFPSSLHHRTIPFTTDLDRIIVSFDLLPEAAGP